jgi:glutamate-1-semialdehyde aminotransferase
VNAEDAGTADPDAAAAFHIGLLNRGIFIAPRGLMATATVAEEQDVRDLVAAARDLFAALA